MVHREEKLRVFTTRIPVALPSAREARVLGAIRARWSLFRLGRALDRAASQANEADAGQYWRFRRIIEESGESVIVPPIVRHSVEKTPEALVLTTGDARELGYRESALAGMNAELEKRHRKTAAEMKRLAEVHNSFVARLLARKRRN